MVSSTKSLNRSSGLSKQLSKAAGEQLVSYLLTRRGWFVVNANSGVQNMANLDLIALKGKRRVTIQVKAGRAISHVPLAGTYKSNSNPLYFNTKEGPKADVVAFVRLDPKGDDEVFFVPVRQANTIARKLGEAEAAGKKKRGSSLNFPLWCRVNGKTSIPHQKAAMKKMLLWRNTKLEKIV